MSTVRKPLSLGERVLAAASLLLLGHDRITPRSPRTAPLSHDLNASTVPILGTSQAGFPVTPPTDLSDLPEAYSLIPTVYAGVYAIAHAIASIPLVVNRRTADGPVQVPDHELLRLLSPEFGTPNPNMSAYDLWEAYSSFLELTGNAYWYLDGSGVRFNRPPTSITPLRPDLVRPVLAADGTPLGYDYRINGENQRLDASQIIHFKFFHPLHPVIGHSSVLASKAAILLDLWAVEWNKQFFQNGATIGPIINFKDEPSEQVLRERMRAFNAKYSGNAGRHQAHGISGDTEITIPEQSHQDMGFYDGLKWTDSRVLMGLGVPPVLVTLLEGSHYENTEAQIKVFWEMCIKPKLRKRDAALNRTLVPRYGADLYISYDKSAITALRQALKDIVETVRAFVPLGVMTPNEGRVYLESGEIPPLPALEGGDEARVHQQLPAEAGDENGNSLRPRVQRSNAIAAVLADVERNAQARRVAALNAAGDAFRSRRTVRVNAQATAVATFLKGHFSEQEKALKAAINGIVAGANAGDGGLRACCALDPDTDRYRNDLSEIDLLMQGIREGNKAKQRAIYQRIVGTFGQQVMVDLGTRAAGVIFRTVSHRTLEFVAVHALANLTHMDRTTSAMVKARFRAALAESQLEGDNLLSTAKRIMETAITDSFQSRRDNANRIAQTETTGAYNFANDEAMVQSDVVATKVWHNQGDDVVRGANEKDDEWDHWEMEGVEVAVDQPFMVPNRSGTPEPLRYPGDPAGSAANVIACRCVVLAGQFKDAENSNPIQRTLGTIRGLRTPIFGKDGHDAG